MITTIDNIEKIKVDFTLPEKYNLLLTPNVKIEVESIAVPNKIFSGVIAGVVPRVSTVSRNISVRGLINNSEMLLRPGMMLRVSIELKDREGIQIPEKALFGIGEKNYVFVLHQADDKNTVELREVFTDERKNGLVEITKGLSEGEFIVSDGSQKLTNEAQVDVVRDDTEDFMKSINRNDEVNQSEAK